MAYGNCLLKRQGNVYCTTICHDCFEILIVFIFPNAHFIIYLADDLQSRTAIKTAVQELAAEHYDCIYISVQEK